MMKVYLCAAFIRREEMSKYARQLRGAGIEVVSSWLQECDKNTLGTLNPSQCEQRALIDLDEIDKCDAFVCFTEPRNSGYWSGGRHVEFGYVQRFAFTNHGTIAKPIILCGEPENVFHHLPHIEMYATWDQVLTRLSQLSDAKWYRNEPASPALST